MTFKEWKSSVDWTQLIWSVAFFVIILFFCFGKNDGKSGCQLHVQWGQPTTQATK